MEESTKNYVILDLEMCHIAKAAAMHSRLRNELIQIGAVLLDEDYEICDTFNTYVHPEHGGINGYIENLTGITNENLVGAPCAKDALEQFANWLPDGAVIVSWSDSDYYQLLDEMGYKEIYIQKIDDCFDTWVDCQVTFAEHMQSPGRCYKLSEAVCIAGTKSEDGVHNALIDAKNTAYLFAEMEKHPDKKFCCTVTDDVPVYNPFSELLGKFNFAG